MAQLQTIEMDGYDLDVFERILRTEPGLQATEERLGRLLPHPRPLLADLFGVLFKLNVLVRSPQEISPAVLVNRRLVDAVMGHPGARVLRAQTQLDESETRDALVLLAERVLRAITRKGRLDAEVLAEGMEIAEGESDLDEKKKTLEYLQNAEPGVDDETRATVAKALKKEISALERKLRDARKAQTQHVDALPIDLDNEVGSSVERMSDEMAQLDQDIRGLGLASGGDGKNDARRKLELGERLGQSKKLRLLARLAGAFREVAFEARKKSISRVPQTMHAVTQGHDLGHLLPSELLGLNPDHRMVHLDFLRRFVEGRLLQYDLRAPAHRGPLVVCVDGSGSMTGSKEIWAKAVALTLMEIARREKRRCLALVFSDGPQLFEVEMLTKGRGTSSRLRVRDESVLAFAEHFPGGGTQFESPLRRAAQAVTEGTYRNGDIVFITDGQASVSPELVRDIETGRKRHRFKIWGLIVDQQDHSSDELRKVVDELRNVSDLTGDALQDLFSAV